MRNNIGIFQLGTQICYIQIVSCIKPTNLKCLQLGSSNIEEFCVFVLGHPNPSARIRIQVTWGNKNGQAFMHMERRHISGKKAYVIQWNCMWKNTRRQQKQQPLTKTTNNNEWRFLRVSNLLTMSVVLYGMVFWKDMVRCGMVAFVQFCLLWGFCCR